MNSCIYSAKEILYRIYKRSDTTCSAWFGYSSFMLKEFVYMLSHIHKTVWVKLQSCKAGWRYKNTQHDHLRQLRKDIKAAWKRSHLLSEEKQTRNEGPDFGALKWADDRESELPQGTLPRLIEPTEAIGGFSDASPHLEASPFAWLDKKTSWRIWSREKQSGLDDAIHTSAGLN